MRRPHPDQEEQIASSHAQSSSQPKKVVVRTCNGLELRSTPRDDYGINITPRTPREDYAFSPSLHSGYEDKIVPRYRGPPQGIEGLLHLDPQGERSMCSLRRSRPYSKEIMDAIESVTFIAEHLKNEDRESSVSKTNDALGCYSLVR